MSSRPRNGLSTYAELTGVSVARNGPNGFQMDEIIFAEQNINAAQDKTMADQNRQKLIESGKNPDEVRNLSDDEVSNLVASLTPTDNTASTDFFTDLTGLPTALGGILFGATGILFGLGTSSPQLPTPPQNGPFATDDPIRRREDEEGGETSDADVSDNPLQDSTNSNGMDQIHTFDRESNSEAGVGVGELESGQILVTQDGIQFNIDGYQSKITDPGEISFFHGLDGADKHRYLELKTNLALAERSMMVADSEGKISVDPTKKDAYEKFIKDYANFVEPKYSRIKNETGELVFSNEQVDQFGKQTSILINGKLFIRENGSDYYSSDAKFPDGKQHKIKITAEGKIKEVTTDPKTGESKSKIFDANGNEIRKDLGKSNQEEFNSFKDYDDKWDKAKEVFVLGKFETAEKMINSSDLSADDKKKMIADLKKYQKEWQDMGSTKQESLHESYLLKKYDLPVLETISTNGKAGDEPVANGKLFKTTVHIVDGSRIQPDPNQAQLMKDFRNELHYKSNNDAGEGPYKVDLNANYNAGNDMMWYGPNTQFRVLDVKIEGGTNAGFDPASPAHGTNIKIALLDAKGHTTAIVDLVHLSVINNQLIEAFQSSDPSKKILPAGTFLGATPKKIGWNEGPHLHMHSFNPDPDKGMMKREDFYDHWIGDRK